VKQHGLLERQLLAHHRLHFAATCGSEQLGKPVQPLPGTTTTLPVLRRSLSPASVVTTDVDSLLASVERSLADLGW
jgi:hypothetical protein